MHSNLSKLQRDILILCQKRAATVKPLAVREIIAHYLKVPVIDPEALDRGWAFSKTKLGPKYNRAMASVSRSIRRLESRGFLIRNWTRKGCALVLITNAGLLALKGLTIRKEEPPAGKGRKNKKQDILIGETDWMIKPLSVTQPVEIKDVEFTILK